MARIRSTWASPSVKVSRSSGEAACWESWYSASRRLATMLRRSWVTPEARRPTVPIRSRWSSACCCRFTSSKEARSISPRSESRETSRSMMRRCDTWPQACWIASRMSAGSQGFRRKRKALARLMAASRASMSAYPVRTIPATSGRRRRSFSSRSTPVIPGMRWSVTTTSSATFSARASASSPEAAVCTCQRSSSSRNPRRTTRLLGSSSTSRSPPESWLPIPKRATSAAISRSLITVPLRNCKR